MYKFSNTSNERLNACDKKLQRVFRLAIEQSAIDFGIASGHRSVKQQQQLYAQGRTKPGNIFTHVDGIEKKSKHNYNPSQAVDIYAWTGEASWDQKELCYLAGVIMGAAQSLNIDLRWGGNWDGDGQMISDQNFIDLPHFEL